jgi:hypothetical protein
MRFDGGMDAVVTMWEKLDQWKTTRGVGSLINL